MRASDRSPSGPASPIVAPVGPIVLARTVARSRDHRRLDPGLAAAERAASEPGGGAAAIRMNVTSEPSVAAPVAEAAGHSVPRRVGGWYTPPVAPPRAP